MDEQETHTHTYIVISLKIQKDILSPQTRLLTSLATKLLNCFLFPQLTKHI